MILRSEETDTPTHTGTTEQVSSIIGNVGKCAKLPPTITLRYFHYILLIQHDSTTVFIYYLDEFI